MKRLTIPIRGLVPLTLCSAALLASCTPRIAYQENIEDYRREIKALERKILTDPEDARAIADLGIIYFATENYARAEAYLRNAFEKNPLDVRTAFYLGLTYEFRNKPDLAIAVHSRYREYSGSSGYRRMMAGRYRRLFLQKVRYEIDSLLARENELRPDRIARSAVAVFPLRYQGQDPEFAELGYGLSEMISIDLGRVKALTVLERIRLQALAEELQLAESELVDRLTAPRTGLLLGAGRIIAGAFDVIARQELAVDVLAADIRREFALRKASKSDALENFYRLEKAIVFGLLAEMGIELTPEEREEILRVPTRNLQAFLAYCKGLEQESRGLYLEAYRRFEQAVQLDPAFKAAADKAEVTAALSDPGGRRGELARMTIRRERLLRRGRHRLLQARLRHLSTNLRAIYLQGVERRQPIQEAANAGLRDLPVPPAPPRVVRDNQ